MRVLIATGSSGGHIFPAIALAEALSEFGHEVLLVLPQKSPKDNIPIFSWQVRRVPAVALSFNLKSKNILGLYFCLSGAWESLRIIIKFKPEVAVGFGSLNTVALIFWAWLFRIKTIIHEQNVICGRANRLLSKLVDRVAISFSQTRDSLSIASEKIVLTGNPLRQDLARWDKNKAADFLKLSADKFTILIIGGSQGSVRLNTACFEALAAYRKLEDLQVIHICGTLDFNGLQDRYAASGLRYKLFDFLPQMQYAYSLADLVICRAGATTIAELRKFSIPAILLPYPFAYAHQLANAQILQNIGAAEVLLDAQLSVNKLKEKFQEYLFNNEKLKAMQKAYQKLSVLDARATLVHEVLSLK